MYRTLRHASSLAALASASLLTSLSLAHIDLQEPEPRAHGTGGAETPDTNSNQKSGPCGQSANARTTDRVTTYAPGETITVRLNEEINHTSYYRVWLNPNGDTFPVRQAVQAQEDLATALAADQALDQPGDADGRLLGVFADNSTVNNNEVSLEVTLPADIQCTNCTLQVIQFMYGAPNPYYFQCADLVIGDGGDVGGDGPDAGAGGSANAGQGGASLGGTGGVPATGAGGTSNLGAGGAPPVGAAGTTSSAGAPATGAGGTGTTPGAAGAGAPIVAGDDADDEDSGCSMAPGTSASLLGVGSLVLFVLSAMRRRSRRY